MFLINPLVFPFLYLFFVNNSFNPGNKDEEFVDMVFNQQILNELIIENKQGDSEGEIVHNGSSNNNVPFCQLDLSSLESNSNVAIDCNLDLGGNTVILSENINLVYKGGSIINGTLHFDGGRIDGRLLNLKLDIIGSVVLTNPVFHFSKEKWGIVEGEVSNRVAIDNLNNLNKAILQIKRFQGGIFEIDDLDAYFGVSHTEIRNDPKASIMVPSDTHFKMGNNCTLRVQPNGKERYVLLYPERSGQNIIISGGRLVGDRYEHDYSSPGTHEWGHLIAIRGVHNSTIDGVEILEGSGDGIHIAGISHRNNDGSLKPNGRESHNITVINCIIDDNRRNNISITDGTNIIVENNLIKNSGSGVSDQGITSSNGTSPRAGIDIEAFKRNAPNNNYVYDWQKTEEIHIRHNTFVNNYSADLVFYNGERAYAYGNRFSGTISTSYGYNNKIYDNIFVNEGDKKKAVNIEPKYRWANGSERTTDYEIYNNTIQGYKFGIIIGGKGHNIHDNYLTDNERGITLLKSDGIVIDNNQITSSIDGSYGYYTFSVETSIRNTTIKNGEVSVDHLGLYFSNKNLDHQGSLIIKDVVFKNSVSLRNVHNTTIEGCEYEVIKITECDPILIDNKSN